MQILQLTQQQQSLLQEFELQLDPAQPEQGVLEPRIIGYGEMSTVFTFGDERLTGLAFKRMALFQSEQEVAGYQSDYLAYHSVLHAAGVQTPDYGAASIQNASGKPILYLLQSMLPGHSICHRLLHKLDLDQALQLQAGILEKIGAVNLYAASRPELDLGFDAQFSNWALQNITEPGEGHKILRFPEKLNFIYFDTSTPLMRTYREEHLDPELFLRICPASLVWIIRRFFLADVLNRYYEPRMVALDMIANLYKEELSHMIGPMLAQANRFLENLYIKLEQISGNHQIFRALSHKEIRAYYKEDAFIWRLFLGLRRMERSWRRIRGQSYPLILPGKIKR